MIESDATDDERDLGKGLCLAYYNDEPAGPRLGVYRYGTKPPSEQEIITLHKSIKEALAAIHGGGEWRTHRGAKVEGHRWKNHKRVAFVGYTMTWELVNEELPLFEEES